ncbi:hypothetical protein Cgig2_006538 [Carnegiea gigantea]|uniref:Uncharacterized protein n=1 Tax=Carnegiea gigantea TaxID=171969 RepID=A0A9Q1GJS2_9CARY|nr:hypothetical protein Cgig2_006538 [Carnegiea gigantea]
MARGRALEEAREIERKEQSSRPRMTEQKGLSPYACKRENFEEVMMCVSIIKPKLKHPTPLLRYRLCPQRGPLGFRWKHNPIETYVWPKVTSEVEFSTARFWAKAYNVPGKKQTTSFAQLLTSHIGEFVGCNDMTMLDIDKALCFRVDIDISKPLRITQGENIAFSNKAASPVADFYVRVILSLVKQFDFVSWSFVKRGGNRVAHDPIHRQPFCLEGKI